MINCFKMYKRETMKYTIFMPFIPWKTFFMFSHFSGFLGSSLSYNKCLSHSLTKCHKFGNESTLLGFTHKPFLNAIYENSFHASATNGCQRFAILINNKVGGCFALVDIYLFRFYWIYDLLDLI